MNGAARTIQSHTAAVCFKLQDRASPNRKPRNRFAGRETGGTRQAKQVIRRERNDLVVAAPAALIAEV